MSAWPYDPETRAKVTARLYAALPELYRLRDATPEGEPGELAGFLSVLAAPLAVIRQSVEELHEDLFIETCRDELLDLFADLIGTRPAFTDPAANRRDLRGSVGWRRRKGTPSGLREMARELIDRPTVTTEGWRRVQITQDLRTWRPERRLPDVRDARLAERLRGPLDAEHHLMDVRRDGLRHPTQLAHWVHPTHLAPVRGGTPVALEGAPDARYAFHPAGAPMALRARPAHDADRLATDRVPPLHFAADPGAWFGVDGRFAVRAHGLLAATPVSVVDPPRAASVPADPALVGGLVRIRLLEYGPGSGAVGLRVCAATANTHRTRGGLAFPEGTAVEGTEVALTDAHAELHMGERGGKVFFGGAIIEIQRRWTEAALEVDDLELAARGHRRGCVLVRVPRGWIRGRQTWRIMADGSLWRDGVLASPPVGPAWPPSPMTTASAPFRAVRPARAPRILHGCQPLRRRDDGWAPTEATVELVFAARYVDGVEPVYCTLGRLRWKGASATAWIPGPEEGGWPARFEAWLAGAEAELPRLQLAVYAHARTAGVHVLPGEVAWQGDDGSAVLIHLPRLQAQQGRAVAYDQDADPRARPVHVAGDGSTRRAWTDALARASWGPCLPLADEAGLRRRLLRYRPLPDAAPATEGAVLDVDPERGRFAFDLEGAPAAADLTVDFEDAATGHVGARPDARTAALGATLPQATRLVSASGVRRFRRPEDHALAAGGRLYRTLAEAFAAIAADPAEHEVIRFEDNATYREGRLRWPEGPPEAPLDQRQLPRRLSILAAEGVRPALDLELAAPRRRELAAIELLGLSLRGELRFPRAHQICVRFCTARPQDTWYFDRQQAPDAVIIERCLAGSVTRARAGRITIRDSALDGALLAVPTGLCQLERSTILAQVLVLRLEASRTLFTRALTDVRDRERSSLIDCLPHDWPDSGDEEGPRVRFLSRDREAPAYLRLAPERPLDDRPHPATRDGAEIGVWAHAGWWDRERATARRLAEHTPAGVLSHLRRVPEPRLPERPRHEVPEARRPLPEPFVVLSFGAETVARTPAAETGAWAPRLPDVSDRALGERVAGPLDATPHLAGLRADGRHHPNQVTWWVHPTHLLPLDGGTPANLGDGRFAFHPLGADLPLRARPVAHPTTLRTDRVPPLAFADAPADWFGVPGRFAVRSGGVLAGVPVGALPELEPSRAPASTALVDGPVRLRVLAVDDPLATDVTVRVSAATDGAVRHRGELDLRTGEATLGGDSALADARAELHVEGGREGAPIFFGGATVTIARPTREAERPSEIASLAVDGYRRGALIVRVPAGWVEGRAIYRIMADGGLRDGDAVASAPVGPAWPPTPGSQVLAPWTAVTPARSPVVARGCALEGEAAVDLIFAAVSATGYRTVGRLHWTGDPDTTTWHPEAPIALTDAQLVVYARAASPTSVLPGLIIWQAATGEATVIHLPQLDALTGDTSPAADDLEPLAQPARVHADGSTRRPAGGRRAWGPYLPLDAGPLLRRRVEYAPLPDDAPPPDGGVLAIDPARGRFAFAADETPPALTVDFQDGSSGRVGARPDTPLDPWRPTRLVSASGRYPAQDERIRALVAEGHLYPSLRAALAALGEENAVHEVIAFADSGTYDEGALAWHPEGAAVDPPPRLNLVALDGARPVVVLDTPAPPATLSYERIECEGLAFVGDLRFPHADRIRLRRCTALRADSTWRFDMQEAGDTVIIERSITAGVGLARDGALIVRDSIVDGPALSGPNATCTIERATVLAPVEVQRLEATRALFRHALDQVTDRANSSIRECAAPDLEGEGNYDLSTHPAHFVSIDRHDPAYLRLADTSSEALRRQPDGAELGAWAEVRWRYRELQLRDRLEDELPSGLAGVLRRVD